MGPLLLRTTRNQSVFLYWNPCASAEREREKERNSRKLIWTVHWQSRS